VERLTTVDTESMLTRREATLRSAATACLAGIALVQAIELPSLLVQGGQFAVLALVTMAVCVGSGLALAAAPARVARQVWGVVATTGGLVLAGWLAPRLFAVPGLAHHQGHWVTGGLLAGALGAAGLVLAAIAVAPTRAAARTVAGALVVLGALVPGVGALLAAFGPGLHGGETALASGNAHHHVHSAGLDETQIVFQPLPGGHGGHFVYKATATPHQTVLGVALIVLAALVFTYGAVGYLRRRSAPGASVDFTTLEGGLA
jgi:hypothetical protein